MPQPVQITTSGVPLQAATGESPITVADVAELSDVAAGLRPPDSVYIHVPFCFHKCHYCDFYSLVDTGDRRGAFVDRLVAEIAAAAPRFTRAVTSVFIGGGTPTLLDPGHWDHLLGALQTHLPGMPGVECTVEANPETVTAERAAALVAGGVDRVSIGAQSFDPRHLKTLERHHDPASVGRAVDTVRRAGIHRVSLDLIFGIPGQTLGDWERDLDSVLALEPDHLSCYGLMYEAGTPLTRRRDTGRLEPIDHDVEAAMYEHTIDRLAGAGFESYEISNWARPGEACRHNLAYWTGGGWWPFGPGAVGQARDADGLGGWRWRNLPRLGTWLASDAGDRPGAALSPIRDLERIEPETARGERFMLGLRLTAGLADDVVASLLEDDPDASRRLAAIDGFVADGRLERTDGHLRLTPRGRMTADSVVAELL